MIGTKIPFNEYRSINALNASVIKAGVSGVYQAYHAINSSFDNDAMAFGRAVHHYLLERESFEDHFIVSPKFDRRTKAGKEGADAFKIQASGKSIIDAEDFDKLVTIESNLKANDFFQGAMKHCHPEISYQWTDTIPMKARLDLVDESGVIIDLKTVRSADYRDVQRDIISRAYDVQMYHYSKALDVKAKLVILAIEAEGHFAIYDISEMVYSEFTKKRYHEGFINAVTAQGLTQSPDKYPSYVQTMSLPAW
jgi:hypothetical protein